MAGDQAAMSKHKIAIATVSLGMHTSHTLEKKIESAASQGFDGLEMVHWDLVDYAKSHDVPLLKAASTIGDMCAARNLSIVTLQPFMNFDGAPTSLESRLSTAREWIDLARALRTNIIQVPSSFEKTGTGNEDIIVKELQALADCGLEEEPPVSFAYEALSWGCHVALMDDAIRIVKLVNRSNFGLCLDTYHVLARVWADPRSIGGRLPGGDAALRATIDRFMKDCPVDKIFYIQLSDAEKLKPPLLPGHPAYNPDEDPTMSWCLYGRLFPLEKDHGAYFPLEQILKSFLVGKGWTGWVAMEMFHRDEKKEEVGPKVLAERGMESWTKVKALVGL